MAKPGDKAIFDEAEVSIDPSVKLLWLYRSLVDICLLPHNVLELICFVGSSR